MSSFRTHFFMVKNNYCVKNDYKVIKRAYLQLNYKKV